MVISVSQLKEHLMCPMFSHYRNVLHRGKESHAPALEFGTMWHEAMAARLNDETYCAVLSEEQEKDWGKYLQVAAEWQRPEGWETLAIEQERRLQIGMHQIVGRLDHEVRFNGGIWHNQHKTLAATVPLSVYIEQQATDWHEIAYGKMIEQHYKEKCMGTIITILRKTKEPVPVQTFYLPRTDAIVDEAMKDMEQLIYQIAEQYQPVGDGHHPLRILKNRESCGGKFRNSLCQYKGVCDHTTSIDDEMFVDLEVRYAPEASRQMRLL